MGKMKVIMQLGGLGPSLFQKKRVKLASITKNGGEQDRNLGLFVHTQKPRKNGKSVNSNVLP